MDSGLSRGRTVNMRRGATLFAQITGVLSAVLILTGCGTSSDEELVSQILREYSSVEPAGYADSGFPGGLYSDLGLTMPTAPSLAVATAALTTGGELPIQAADVADLGGLGEQLRAGAVTIQPDTVLRITVKEDPSLNGTYKVTDQGSIQFKYVGLTFLDNLTVEEAEARIRERLEGVYVRQATVDIQILQASYDRIRVEGLVKDPGPQKIGAGSRISLHAALLRAGGVVPSAQNAVVKIIRNGVIDPIAHSRPSEVVSLIGADGRPQVPEIFVSNNDLVQVGQREQTTRGGKRQLGGGVRILLLGEVGKPGYVEFGAGEEATLLNLVFRIGGFSRWANDKKIEVVRRNGYGLKEVFVVNAREIQEYGDPEDDFAFEHGDVVRVPPRRWPLF